MTLLGYPVTAPLIFVAILHVAGFWVLYSNRADLLYDNEDKDPSTPNTLSMGRCWSWMLFYLAFSFWLRFVMGEIPSTTPFPPGLQEMLYACLLYEFAKKGVDVSTILLRGRRPDSYGGPYSGPPYDSPQHGAPYNSPAPIPGNTDAGVTPEQGPEAGPPRAGAAKTN